MLAGEHIAMLDSGPSPDLAASAPQAAPYRVVVIGGSAGGFPALAGLLSALPPDFGLPILVVLHLSATKPSKLPTVLAYHTGLRVKWAEHGERMRPGVVYVAPSDRHLLVGKGGQIEIG